MDGENDTQPVSDVAPEQSDAPAEAQESKESGAEGDVSVPSDEEAGVADGAAESDVA